MTAMINLDSFFVAAALSQPASASLHAEVDLPPNTYGLTPEHLPISAALERGLL